MRASSGGTPSAYVRIVSTSASTLSAMRPEATKPAPWRASARVRVSASRLPGSWADPHLAPPVDRRSLAAALRLPEARVEGRGAHQDLVLAVPALGDGVEAGEFGIGKPRVAHDEVARARRGEGAREVALHAGGPEIRDPGEARVGGQSRGGERALRIRAQAPRPRAPWPWRCGARGCARGGRRDRARAAAGWRNGARGQRSAPCARSAGRGRAGGRRQSRAGNPSSASKRSSWRPTSAATSSFANWPRRATTASRPIGGKRPSGASVGIGASGAPSVRLR